MHYSTLTILPILALVALTTAAPIAIKTDFSIPQPVKTSDTDAAGAPILPKRRFARRAVAPVIPKRSAEEYLNLDWMGDFAKEKRSVTDSMFDFFTDKHLEVE